MNDLRLTELGKLASLFKYSGQIHWEHPKTKKPFEKDLHFIFLKEVNGDIFIPYFIRELKQKNEHYSIVLLEDIDTDAKALTIINRKVYVKSEDYEKYMAKTKQQDFTEYTLYNDKNIVGKILAVYEHGEQRTAELEYNNKNILVPLHNDFIVSVDTKTKTIHTQLPEGILEI